MSINEIKESGLLELYVLGVLDGEELLHVEQALSQYPELKSELNEIERSLQGYAFANTVTPSPELKDKILSDVNSSTASPNHNTDSNKGKTGTNSWSFLVAFLSLLLAGIGYLWYQANQENQRLQEEHKLQLAICDSIQLVNDAKNLAYESITDPNVDVIAVAATEKYPSTQLYFYHNPVNKKNYIKLNALPTIDQNTQSFQLWSIKGTNPPVPLDVFQGQDSILLEVQHVDATEVYAITIEPKGGQDTPTLANLIGTFSI